eukprot:2595051-Karenia_brevis.AAC.1
MGEGAAFAPAPCSSAAVDAGHASPALFGCALTHLKDSNSSDVGLCVFGHASPDGHSGTDGCTASLLMGFHSQEPATTEP